MVADIEELETMDASEIYSKKTQCKGSYISPKNGKFIFPVADGRIKFAGGDQELRTSTLIRDHPIRGESNIDFLGESEGSPSGVRLTKRQATFRPDHFGPELWRRMSKNAKQREKHKWAIDPEDKEFKETFKNARRKLETPMAPAMRCKTCKKNKHGETRGKTNDFKSKFACILEASESTRMRMEESLPKYHEDHIARKGYNSLQNYN